MYHASFFIFIITNTEQARQQEWNSNHTMARNNDFPLQVICNLKNKLIHKTQKTENTLTLTQRKNWVKYTYHSPLIQTCSKVLT
jgi:hypothetical protein